MIYFIKQNIIHYSVVAAVLTVAVAVLVVSAAAVPLYLPTANNDQCLHDIDIFFLVYLLN